MTPGSPLLPERLRLIVITDAALAGPRGVVETVRAALAGGAPAIQLRDKGGSARDLLALGERLKVLTEESDALLFVNDRLDVALALEADGVHLGPDDLPVTAARRTVPPGFLIGYSTDDPAEAQRAVSAGADYLGCGAIWPTATKQDSGSAIGPEGLDAVARAVRVPVVGIGGVTPELAPQLARTAAVGVAVVGAVMSAADPEATVRELLSTFGGLRREMEGNRGGRGLGVDRD